MAYKKDDIIAVTKKVRGKKKFGSKQHMRTNHYAILNYSMINMLGEKHQLAYCIQLYRDKYDHKWIGSRRSARIVFDSKGQPVFGTARKVGVWGQ